MRYEDAVASAPAGSERFRPADLARLGRASMRRLLAPGPSAPPLDDVAAALAGDPPTLLAIASSLQLARGERLPRLSRARCSAGGCRAWPGRPGRAWSCR